jgi:hypothetical protein
MANCYYIARNTDSDDMFYKALMDAGFVESLDPWRADFILHDAIHPGLEKVTREKPTFVYPHTPQSCFLWDGILDTPSVCCNFVSGRASQKAMKAYGYPHRVETIGFTRCRVREFEPTQGNDLLIVPAHALQHGEYTNDNYIELVIPTLRFVLQHRYAFGKIVLCWNETKLPTELMEALKSKGMVTIQTNPYKDREPLKRMVERLERADLVFACNTAGCVSVAMGRPTVFITELGVPGSRPRFALHPNLYAHFLRFPLAVENMRIQDILEVRTAPNEEVEHWKSRVIGGQFDAERFIGIVREYVK